MNEEPPWRWSAVRVAEEVRAGRASAVAVTESVLARIAQVNPGTNAITQVMASEAFRAAEEADVQLARGEKVGALHGVPVTIKINVDVSGQPTTDGVVAFKNKLATADSPLVSNLRSEGAIIIGRNNAPAFSLQWFTENDLHGATLNPFDAGRTPGGSSGGAAAAVATGMGPVAHGNDYGGSVRHPAWCCGVVGLRTSVGRVPAFRGTAPNRSPANQLMSSQGILTRSVEDARLTLGAIERGSPLDPNWRAPPSCVATAPCKVAVFASHPAYPADPRIVRRVMAAAEWLARAGYEVEEASPPHFEEAASLWRQLVFEDLRHGMKTTIEELGSASIRRALQFYYGHVPSMTVDEYITALTRRLALSRQWSLFLHERPVLLLPISWEVPFAVGDDNVSGDRMEQILRAQSPLLATALLGLPALSVPTGMDGELPGGVHLVGAAFSEERLLKAGEVIERAAGFSALDALLAREAAVPELPCCESGDLG